MNYESTLNFLYNRLQSFHNQGAVAYKPGLEKALKLSDAFGNPHLKFKSIHVGGTNGKGSTAHSIASVLMECGYKVGLYTSPHLIDFRERIRVNGTPIRREDVIDFVDRFINKELYNCDPSFFELTTIMAFEYFAKEQVDFAVIEVGLGGRLDTTNIITPELSVITNISYDHTSLLGDTLGQIAEEKAGIIKKGVPAVIGRHHPETDSVFLKKSPDIIFAQDIAPYRSIDTSMQDQITYKETPWGDVISPLTGNCQPENMQTILAALSVLNRKIPFRREDVQQGLKNVIKNTGLMGRWMIVSHSPLVVCDTAHNPDGWLYISRQLQKYEPENLFLVLGFVNDKDYGKILEMIPPHAHYYFVEPSVSRRAKSTEVAKIADAKGIKGRCFENVRDGFYTALSDATKVSNPIIFVGGSTFVVADFLTAISSREDGGWNLHQ